MIFEAVPGFLSLLKFCRKDLVFVGRASFFFWIGLTGLGFILTLCAINHNHIYGVSLVPALWVLEVRR